jgi:hypothetical protein
VKVSIFIDKNEGDVLTVCDVCCGNGEKSSFELDSCEYVDEFREWLSKKPFDKSKSGQNGVIAE